MDWFQLLILALFFLFPLIQQMLGAARRSRQQEMTIEGEEDEELEWAEEAVEPRTRVQARPQQDDEPDDWATGWLEWPSPEGEREAEPVTERVGRELELDTAPAPAPTPAPATIPAPAPEPEPGLRDADRALPPDSPAKPGAAGRRLAPFGEETELVPVAGPTVPARARGPRPPVVHRQRRSSTMTPLSAALATRSALRQAVVLHEVLGPPVALQPPGDRPS